MDRAADILVIDDEESICFAFRRYFERRGCTVRVAATGGEGLARWRERRPDVVFLDVRLPDGNGLDVLEAIRGEDPSACVIVISAYGSLATVTRAVASKAFDYLVKPLDLDRAGELLSQALASREVLASAPPAGPAAEADEAGVVLIGASAAMQEVYKRIGKVAQSGAAVLIRGETGTGKEVVARAIHAHSPRREKPFVAVNCGALPESLVESELFGYARGAFTGAEADKPGRFESAEGGTLFLDEVGELPPATQVKLLRFLDSQIIERLGSVRSISLDVRILAATNRDLPSAIRTGRVRADLFYRLAVIQIDLPPLRRRMEDVLPLAAHFLADLAAPGAAPSPISKSAAAVLAAYAWPGNVRELRNAMENAAVVSGGGPILPVHLPESVRAGRSAAEADRSAGEGALGEYLDLLGPREGELHRQAVEGLERALLRRVLAETRGSRKAAAERLGLHRNTLRNKLRSLGLEDAGSD